MKAFGFSEHGSCFQWLHKKEDIEKAVSDSAYQEELIQYYGLDREEEKLEV